MFAKIAAKRRGFTLIELLVVIVIIAVLALIAIPRFQDAGTRSKEASLKSDLSLVRSAVATYYTDTGAFPTGLPDLIATTAPATGLSSTAASVTISATDWHGPYLQTVPSDPMQSTTTQFSYTATAPTASNPIGTVKSTSAAVGLNGAAYNTY
jgi:general secretion pathway protein G